MLAKAHRVSRTQFSSFFKSGKRRHGEVTTLVFSPYPTFHASVVVSKKVSKRAVDRNKIRRQIYGQLYQLKKQNHTGVFIVVVKPVFMSLSRQSALAQNKALIEGVKKP